MPDEQFRELVNRYLDGFVTPDERAALEERIEREPEARKLYEDMREVQTLLADRARVEPPESLRASVAREVERISATASVLPGRFEASRRRQSVFRAGFGIAAVIFAAFLLVPILTNQVDSNQVRGTMAPRESAVTGTLPVERAGSTGAIVARVNGRDVTVRPELTTSGAGRLEVTFARDELTFVAAPGATSVEETETGIIVGFDGSAPELEFERHVAGSLSLSVTVTFGEVSTTFSEVPIPASTNFSSGDL